LAPQKVIINRREPPLKEELSADRGHRGFEATQALIDLA